MKFEIKNLIYILLFFHKITLYYCTLPLHNSIVSFAVSSSMGIDGLSCSKPRNGDENKNFKE